MGGTVWSIREVRDRKGALGNTRQTDGYSFSTETAVAFITAKTLSPSLRFIRFTELVVIIDVTVPAAVRITTSDTTLSEMIFSIMPDKRFRMLTLMVIATFVQGCSNHWLAAVPPATNP